MKLKNGVVEMTVCAVLGKGSVFPCLLMQPMRYPRDFQRSSPQDVSAHASQPTRGFDPFLKKK